MQRANTDNKHEYSVLTSILSKSGLSEFWKNSLQLTYGFLTFRKYVSRIHIKIPSAGCIGLILHSATVATASWSTFEGTMRVLCRYSCRVPL